MYYLTMFGIFSIIGWLFETIISFLIGADFNSGIMYGPWTPVYGFCVITMVVIWRKLLYKFQNYKIFKSIIFFFLTMIILSIFELIAGLLIQFLMGITYWDYSKTFPFHIGKFISVEVGAFWGLLSLITIWFIIPKIDKIIPTTPKYIIFIFYIIFGIDLTITIFTKFI